MIPIDKKTIIIAVMFFILGNICNAMLREHQSNALIKQLREQIETDSRAIADLTGELKSINGRLLDAEELARKSIEGINNASTATGRIEERNRESHDIGELIQRLAEECQSDVSSLREKLQ